MPEGDKTDQKQDKPIEYRQAPCGPDGILKTVPGDEDKEGICFCREHTEGCCTDSFGIIYPRILKEPPQPGNQT